MNPQLNQPINQPIDLDSMSDNQLLKLMDDIPKILKKRQAKEDKQLRAKLSKEAKANGYKVSFEKLPSKG